MLHALTVPTLAFHADKDSLVSKKSVKFFHTNEQVTITHLHSSYHQYFTEEDYSLILSSFTDLIDGFKPEPH